LQAELWHRVDDTNQCGVITASHEQGGRSLLRSPKKSRSL
jgi:hypothetical protein